MTILNERNAKTAKKIHLMLTNKCDRDCKYCCNKSYDIYNDVDVVTPEELEEAEQIFMTGGEPFTYAYPNMFAALIKKLYPNIQDIFVYTNALPLKEYLLNHGKLDHIDGLTISLKNRKDVEAFWKIKDHKEVQTLKNKIWVYCFPGCYIPIEDDHFITKLREWQTDFQPAPDSIFRRVSIFPEELEVEYDIL